MANESVNKIRHGAWLKFPIQADQRGSLAVVSDLQEMVEQSIKAILETRQGERVLVPEYGMPDYVFSVVGAGFAAAFAYEAERQIKRWEPLIKSVKVKFGFLRGNNFQSGLTLDQQRVAVLVQYTLQNANTAENMVYPVWRLRNAA